MIIAWAIKEFLFLFLFYMMFKGHFWECRNIFTQPFTHWGSLLSLLVKKIYKSMDRCSHSFLTTGSPDFFFKSFLPWVVWTFSRAGLVGELSTLFYPSRGTTPSLPTASCGLGTVSLPLSFCLNCFTEKSTHTLLLILLSDNSKLD